MPITCTCGVDRGHRELHLQSCPRYMTCPNECGCMSCQILDLIAMVANRDAIIATLERECHRLASLLAMAPL